MQYTFEIKDQAGNVVAEGEFMSIGGVQHVSGREWSEALEEFVGTTRMLNAMSPNQRELFLAKFVGPMDKAA